MQLTLKIYYNKFSIQDFAGFNKGTMISEQQFKTFQLQQENELNSEAKIHVQRCAFLKHLTEIKEEDVLRVKWDTEYLQTIPEEAIKVLEKKWDELKDKIVVPFNKSGLTIDDCIKMCLAHDDTISKNKKHPLTEDQIKQNLANKKKQEESNKLKKSKNDESTIIN